MNNIDSFNIAVAEVFGQCYKAFPTRIEISVIEIGDAILAASDSGCINDIDLRRSEYEIARASIVWLIEFEYLWSEATTDESFLFVTLSPKGLEVLNEIPDELQKKTTLGEELGKGVKEIGKEAALSLVKKSLSYGASLMLGA